MPRIDLSVFTANKTVSATGPMGDRPADKSGNDIDSDPVREWHKGC